MVVTCSMCLNCELCMLFISTIRESIFELKRSLLFRQFWPIYIIFMVIFPQLRRHLLDSNSSIFVENVGAFEAWRHLLQYMIFNYKNEAFTAVNPLILQLQSRRKKPGKSLTIDPRKEESEEEDDDEAEAREFPSRLFGLQNLLLLHKMYVSYFYPWSVNLKVDMLRR